MRVLCSIALFAVLPATTVGAQVFRIPRGSGEASVEMNGEQWSYARGGATAFLGTRESTRLPFSGSLFAQPYGLTYSLTVRPQLTQQRASVAAGAYVDRNLGFDANVGLFQSSPIAVSLYANRAGGTRRAAVGSVSDFALADRGAIVRLQNSYFPITLQHSDRFTTNGWQGDLRAPVLPRDERLRSFSLSGQSSKTQLSYERVDFGDRVGSTSFQSEGGSLQHELRWGKGSRLATTLERGVRQGSDAYGRAHLSERLHLQHTRALGSEFLYSQYDNHARGIAVQGRTVGLSERVERGRWLSALVDASRQSTRYLRGQGVTSSVAPRISVSRLTRGMTLVAATSGSYERTRRSLTGDWIDAVAEQHSVDETRTFLLTHPGVDVATLTISSANQTVVYLIDLDYRVIEEGNQLRIIVIPGSRITSGDAVVVSYRYRGERGDDYQMIGASSELSLTSSAFTVRHVELVRAATSFGAAGVAAPSGGNDRASSITARHRMRGTQVDLQLERRARERSVTDFVTSEARLTVLPAARDALQGAFSASATRSVAGGRTIDAQAATGSASWQAWRGLRLQTSLDAWRMRLNAGAVEHLLGGVMEADWSIGDLDAQLRYARQDRRSFDNSTQHRYSLKVVRRF